MKGLLAQAIADHHAGRLDEAEAGYRKLLQEDPIHPYASNNLAILLRRQLRYEEAIDLYRGAIGAIPDEPAFRSNMAGVLTSSAQFPEALATAQAAIALQPGYAEGWFNLGMVMSAMGERADAKKAYRRAIIVNPSMGEAYCNLGDLHQANGDLLLAELSYRSAISVKPELPQPFANLGELLKSTGRVVDAIRLLKDGVARHPSFPLLHSNLILALHYTPFVSPEVIWRAHRRWSDCHAQALMPKDPVEIINPDPARRLRVGYVSPDFCNHPVSRFFEPLLMAHDPSQVETFCYMASSRRDDVTTRLQMRSDHWINLDQMSDAEAADRVRHDQIDILVDLGGHTASSRPLLFARKPAPIQVTWLGYPNTTGMSAIDYRLTDSVADPPGDTERWHSEVLVRLPHGFLSYQPKTDLPPEDVSPCELNGFVTFGSFNNIAKITEQTVELWAKILNRLPSSRILLKGYAFQDDETRARYFNWFARFGVEPSRVELDKLTVSDDDHFRAYGRIDIALDTMPYNGTTTTCEALWMGVPVITSPGSHHVARVSSSILTHLGLEELIADNSEDYVQRTLALAADPHRLTYYRRNLRSLLQDSHLMDHEIFARNVEAAYRTMWQERIDCGPLKGHIQN
jgi:predicted O-linked N-acetylglucosamine transferase (SPINDLY family)